MRRPALNPLEADLEEPVVNTQAPRSPTQIVFALHGEAAMGYHPGECRGQLAWPHPHHGHFPVRALFFASVTALPPLHNAECAPSVPAVAIPNPMLRGTEVQAGT